ncbi:hypothetical protein Tco_1538495 [Tanacetum coccineum]
MENSLFRSQELAGGKLCDLNTEESWVLLEDLSLYDNEIWNDPRDFAKPVKSIALSQDVPSTSNRRLIKLENQVQHLMEAHLALTQLTQVNKITTSCEICSGPHDTQYFMEDPEQAFVEYASSYTDEAGDARLSKFEEKLWDFNQKFVPMDAEKASKKQKSPEKKRSSEKIVKEEAVAQEEKEEVVKELAAKRKKSIPRKTTRKRQKLEEDTDKDELKTFLDIVPREDAPIEVDSLSTKFPIVDWKTVVLTETFMYYQVFRGDGSSKNYKVLSEMLQDFDRMDVEQLFRLVKERYSSSAPEGFDLMLWGDLHTLFEPDEDDEIWKDQHEYNLLSWRLHDFCGIHILLMNNGLAIHMLTEKKYPLSQEMLSKMLSTRLEVDHESSQAFELLRFIRAQVQK